MEQYHYLVAVDHFADITEVGLRKHQTNIAFDVRQQPDRQTDRLYATLFSHTDQSLTKQCLVVKHHQQDI